MTSSKYFLAPSLVEFRDEINERYPHRDKASDGWIGDASHAARTSSHNPLWSAPGKWSGVVRAIDVDNNGAPGEMTPLVNDVMKAAIGDSRVWYVIYNRKIYSRTYGWKPRAYTGSNSHDHHVHISLREEISAWETTARWITKEDTVTKTPNITKALVLGKQYRRALLDIKHPFIAPLAKQWAHQIKLIQDALRKYERK